MAKWNGKDVMIGALIGGIVGAATTLLFAPKAGSELRSDISDQYKQISDKTQEVAKNVSNQTSQLVGKVKEVTSNVVDDVKVWREKKEDSVEREEVEQL